MLILKGIKKNYELSTQVVTALKGVDLNFRQCEFVAILGPSGCGKTTLLNIIGGLDRYTAGDLVIDGKSTKCFKDADWDAYRNRCIGYVFQSYNLIPHLSVLGNVELALTLSGISPKERKARATRALKRVGLEDQLYKRPNQLSGGQMQRVAIARALVNEPKIILADEPTGALDSKTSVQIMELLKEVASDRLVIMVTHNNDLANTYANRTIRLLDGEIEGDTNPYTLSDTKPEQPPAVKTKKSKEKASADGEALKQTKIKTKDEKLKRTSMSFLTALNISFRNLWTKRGRTFSVSFAGSIGIIGIALVLAISNGFKLYIRKLETETLASFPITVSQTGIDMDSIQSTQNNIDDLVEFPKETDSVGVSSDTVMTQMLKANTITPEYVAYVDELKNKKLSNGTNLVLDIQKSYAADMPLYTKDDSTGNVKSIRTSSSQNMFSQLFGSSSSNFTEVLNNPEYFQSQYEEIRGSYPTAYNEIALIVDSYNRISSNLANRLGLKVVGGKIDYNDILNKEYKIILNDRFYSMENGGLTRLDQGNYDDLEDCFYAGVEDEDVITLTVTGVLRVREETAASLYSSGLIYTIDLTERYLSNCKDSDVATFQSQALNKTNLLDQQIYKGLFSSNELDAMLKFFIENEYSTLPNMVLPQILIDEIKNELGDAISGFDQAIQDEFWQVVPYLGVAFNELNNKNSQQFGFAAYYMYYMVNTAFTSLEVVKDSVLARIGKSEIPATIRIFPTSFETRAEVTSYLNAWNKSNPNNVITPTDTAAILSSTMGNMLNIITYVLVAFAAVSLIVSSIMISIITYVSVIERTKEIGILRSIGARKIDVANVFNAETVIIGFVAGCFGVLVAFLLTMPINLIIKAVAGTAVLGNLAILSPFHALMLVCISVVLTLISGLVPSFYASKKDPVVALRTE